MEETEMADRQIKIVCEVYTYSRDIDPVYLDLPEGWDSMTQQEKDAFLTDAAVQELSNHAGSGAFVVDENDNEIDEN
jgi:hypothetical protein